MPLQCKDYEDYLKHLEMEHVTDWIIRFRQDCL